MHPTCVCGGDETMAKQVSEGRRTAYYVGMVLMIIGGLLFASVFVTFAMHFGDFTDFEPTAKLGMLQAIGGVVLLIVGGIIRGIGARGLAGSGVVLDPQRAREDLEPYSRMAGGMVKDALEEAEIDLGAGKSDKVIMVKCRSYGKLNEDDSKFCQECGKQL